uniref:amino acid transporter heavy chain SLC3A1 isoform X2 n=1 Tax=Myxine glutinosa TaxID=7769 RepID=UPI00358ECEA2
MDNVNFNLNDEVTIRSASIDLHPETSRADDSKTPWTDGMASDAPDTPYAGMPKEVLLRFSSQMRYRVVRETLFWLIVVAMVALVVAPIAIIVLSPRCLDWWQMSPIYQVYPLSFKDSDGDGKGDLRGIWSKLDYFEELNIKSIWINPIYKSPMKDSGYDISNFMEIDPIFGTMEDFEDLLTSIHDRGMKLIMDYVPNHSSNEHEWFEKSRKRENAHKDYYMWRNCISEGNNTIPPNNWVSKFGGSAWTYDDLRKQCYFHQFSPEQPDLNFTNPEVFKEAEKTVIHYDDLYHDYTTTQLGLHDVIREWRALLNKKSGEAGKYRLMITESYDNSEIKKTMMYYGTNLQYEADFPFNFLLVDDQSNISVAAISKLLDIWMSNMPKDRWPNWVLGNHDNPRVASNVGPTYARTLNMLLLTLPGTATTYYGEELGMTNLNDSNDEDESRHSHKTLDQPMPDRNGERSPMQWDNSTNGGFSTANETWIPVNQNYKTLNVQVEKDQSSSMLTLYRKLTKLHQSELPMQRGWTCFFDNPQVVAFVRETDGLNRCFIVVLNFGDMQVNVNLTRMHIALHGQATVRISIDGTRDDESINLQSVTLLVGEGMVLEYRNSQPIHDNPGPQKKCYSTEKACYVPMLGILLKC